MLQTTNTGSISLDSIVLSFISGFTIDLAKIINYPYNLRLTRTLCCWSFSTKALEQECILSG